MTLHKDELPSDHIFVSGYLLQHDWVIDGMGSRPNDLVSILDEPSWQACNKESTTGDINLLRDQLVLDIVLDKN
jgi:hypothetical protein